MRSDAGRGEPAHDERMGAGERDVPAESGRDDPDVPGDDLERLSGDRLADLVALRSRP